MAVITSSSGASSAVPAKVVSRRSVRMARSDAALPRRAVRSWARSVSLRGRKSIALPPLPVRSSEGVPRAPPARARHPPSCRGRPDGPPPGAPPVLRGDVSRRFQRVRKGPPPFRRGEGRAGRPRALLRVRGRPTGAVVQAFPPADRRWGMMGEVLADAVPPGLNQCPDSDTGLAGDLCRENPGPVGTGGAACPPPGTPPGTNVQRLARPCAPAVHPARLRGGRAGRAETARPRPPRRPGPSRPGPGVTRLLLVVVLVGL